MVAAILFQSNGNGETAALRDVSSRVTAGCSLFKEGSNEGPTLVGEKPYEQEAVRVVRPLVPARGTALEEAEVVLAVEVPAEGEGARMSAMGEEEPGLLPWPLPAPQEAVGLRGLPAWVSREESWVRGG